MLRVAEDFWDKIPLVDKNFLLAYLGTEHTTVMRVIFAKFNHITDVALGRLKTIVSTDSDEHSAGFKMFLYCQEIEYLQDYFQEILPNIDTCKSQIAGQIQ